MDELLVLWSDEDVDDHALGSGVVGEGGGCVRRARELSDGTGYLLYMDDPEDPDGLCRWFPLTRDDFRRVASEIVAGKHKVRDTIRRDIERNDVDAGAADVIIQIAVYGEIVYG